MTAAGAVHTPFVYSLAQREDSSGGSGLRLWWHRLLPVGEIKYKDRILKFTRPYLEGLVRAFNEGAYDQVPLQLADTTNTHTNDPERYRGDVVGMRVTSDGLWVGVSPTDRGEQVLSDNPALGVSARIVEGYDRADGKFFPAAIQHVLGTLDPRIPKLGAWRAIEASNEPIITIDLTGSSFSEQEEGAGDMPDLTEEQKSKLARLLDLPEDKFTQLVGGLADAPELTDEELEALAAGDDEDEIGDEDMAALIAGLSDEEIAALEAEMEAETAALAGATGLSNEAALALEMANYRSDENARQIAALTAKADKDAYELEKRRLTHDLGIAPSVVEAARPLLEGTGHTVELSNGTTTDAGRVMRAVLAEVGRMGKMIDFGVELGSPMDEGESGAEGARQRASVVQLFKTQTGLG